MPRYDHSELAEQAKRGGFIRDTYEKVCRLADILRFIHEVDELKETLALKGGTAINLGLFDMPRLSVDIDMDFTENLPREEMMIQRDHIHERLGRFMTAEGYEMSARSKISHSLDSFVFTYQATSGNRDHIKIEINYSLRAHMLEPIDINTQSSVLPRCVPIRILAPVEIYSSKIVALVNRTAARDLYDVNNMIYFGLFDEDELILLRKGIVFYSAIVGKQMIKGFSASMLSGITERRIKTDLMPVLRKAESFQMKEAQDRVSAFLRTLLLMNGAENAFIAHFERGTYAPDLLFGDYPEILGRIQRHPMALWRIRRG